MNISSNVRKLTLLFIALFMALSAGLVYWQVVVAQAVTNNPYNLRVYLRENAPVRGRIFDRNGVLLAESVPSPDGGYIRKYYDDSLAPVIGYYVNSSLSSRGIERQYDDYLSGRVGMTALDNTVNKTLHRPPIGDDIYLTIDERIQKSLSQHFDEPYVTANTTPSNRGSAIVSDPHTGDVLAMVSKPSYDPNKLVNTLAKNDQSYFNSLAHDNKNQPLLNHAIDLTYIPGSTYKTVTLMAGLENGATSLTEQFDQEHAIGPVRINGQNIGPDGNNISGYTKRYPVDTEYGFTHSDNVIFAQIGVKTGQEKWLNYNKKFYVGSQIPFDLPVTPSTVLQDNKPLEDNGLAADAFGQGFDSVTPMQMVLFDNAVANDGQLMRPMLISKITDRDKNPVKTTSPQMLFQGLSAQNAAAVRQAMFGVVRCGSGSVVNSLFNSRISIIGKTGTAQVAAFNQNVPPHSWMITEAPYVTNNPSQLPALTIVGMRENGGEGGDAIGPLVAHVYADVFDNKWVTPPDVPPPPSYSSYCYPSGLTQT